MVTQKANLMNLVTPVQKTHNTEISGSSLTESFQSYVAGSNTSLENEASRTMQMPQADMKDANHKEVYEAQKAGKDSYSMSADNAKEPVSNDKETVGLEELSKEELDSLKDSIRAELKKVLGINDEELDTLLAEANVSVLSLMQPENLQAFVLKTMDAEPVDLLTNTELTDAIRILADAITEVADENQVDLSQDLTNIDFTKLEAEMVEQNGSIDVNAEDAMPQQEVADAGQVEMAAIANSQMAEDHEAVSAKAESYRDTEIQKESGKDGVTVLEDGVSVKEQETGITVEIHKEGSTRQEAKPQDGNAQGVAQQVVSNLTQAMGESELVVETSYASQTEQIEIVRQVVEQIRITTGNGLDRLEMQLYPQHLGKIQLQVMMKSGILTAQINAETEAAKQAIESQIQTLKESFEAKGMKVEAVEVSVNTAAFDENRDREGRQATNDSEKRENRGRRGIHLDEFGMPVEELTEEEEVDARRLQAEGASVEYRA